ncbi:MAG TPA: hypothetical protein VFY03_02125, partial [Woeseiaceae bacterium]|nr:hypothetical protein [Woeseiaceae bacterium]
TSRVLASRPLAVTPPAQGPGGLEVFPSSGTTGGFALGPDSAVEIILDASGSMLQRQDGQRRIDIAKAVLTDLATEVIPAGTGFAFRVFGHREAGSCRTDLEIPLSPLDPAQARAVLGGIEATNLAKTPIARSLELVPEDLAGVEGERLVILLTDGEETCGGDPAAAVETLASSGTAARVNIVGFAIDDADLKSRFRYWAELGGGSYFDSTNADELGQALVSALSVPYAVFDSGGLEVAQGQVGGDAVTLPPGEYTVRAATVPPTEKAVTVKSGETARLTLEQP